jgi:hypothetical protein
VCLRPQSVGLRCFAACGREHDGWQYVGHAGQGPASGHDELGRDYPAGQYNARGESNHANQRKGVGYDELFFVSGYLVFWLLVSVIQRWRIDERSALGKQRVFGRGLAVQQSPAVGIGRPGNCRALACYKVRVGSPRLVRQFGGTHRRKLTSHSACAALSDSRRRQGRQQRAAVWRAGVWR